MATSTLQEWVQERSNSTFRTNLFYDNGILVIRQDPLKPDDIIRIPFYNVFIKNRDMFDPITVVRPMEKEYYRQPKKFSYDTYGDIGLWHVLLVMNKCRSEVDFVREKVKYLDPDKVMDYISRMFIDNGIDASYYRS